MLVIPTMQHRHTCLGSSRVLTASPYCTTLSQGDIISTWHETVFPQKEIPLTTLGYETDLRLQQWIFHLLAPCRLSQLLRVGKAHPNDTLGVREQKASEGLASFWRT